MSSLEIVFIEITDDSVTYECAGNNSQGQEQDRIEIKVIGMMTPNSNIYMMIILFILRTKCITPYFDISFQKQFQLTKFLVIRKQRQG